MKVGYDITAHMSPVTIEKEIRSLVKETTDDRLSHHRRGSSAVCLPKETMLDGDSKGKQEEVVSDVESGDARHGVVHEKQVEEIKPPSSALILTQAEMESTMKKVCQHYFVACWVIFHAFLSYADFFQNNFFQTIFSGTLSECQTVWIQIRTDFLLVLI